MIGARERMAARKAGAIRCDVRGFSLIELIVALVVLAAASAGVLLIFAGATARSADPQIRAQARAISEAYMDEILLQAFRDPDQAETGGDEAGEARGSYDDVWDYRAIGTEAPTDQFGNAIGPLADYTVSVQIDGSPAGGRADITVTAAHSSARVSYDLYGERSEY